METIASAEQIQRTIEQILQRPEFGRQAGELQNQTFQALGDGINRILNATGDMTGAPVLLLIVMAASVLFLLIFLVIREMRTRRMLAGVPYTPDAHDDPHGIYMQYAAERAYEMAVIWLFHAYIQDLDATGLLKAHKSKTNLQYERELAQSGRGDLPRFRSFKSLYNSVRYGGQSVDQEAFESWRAYCADYSPGRGGAS